MAYHIYFVKNICMTTYYQLLNYIFILYNNFKSTIECKRSYCYKASLPIAQNVWAKHLIYYL